MKALLALLAAGLLVSSTLADSSTRALTAVNTSMVQPAAAHVSGETCEGLPRVPYFGSMADCKVPAAVGYTCSVSCSKNTQASFDSLPRPTATCTEKGWVVQNPCRRVCMGAPDHSLIDKARGVWATNCADHTLVGDVCQAICYHGGSVNITCGHDGNWPTTVQGQCKQHPRLAQQPLPSRGGTPAPLNQGPHQQQQQLPPGPPSRPGLQRPHSSIDPVNTPGAPASRAVNITGATVDGVLVGGSPKAQEVKTVNYFDPGRVLVRPPLFMNLQVLNENGNLGITIDAKAVEFGAFIGSRDYQLGQFVDLDADSVTVRYAHSGARTCVEAAAIVLRSPAFRDLNTLKLSDDFGANPDANGKLGAVIKRSGEKSGELTVWVPAICFKTPQSDLKAVIRLV